MTQRANADFVVRDGCGAMDFGRVHVWLAASYWVPEITRATVEYEARNSALVIGAFAADGAQIGYARIISDKSRFACFSDVVVDESQRGHGVGRAMVQYALDHPQLATVTIWMLLTRDAHGVYAPLGFRPITAPESTPDRWMVWRKRPPAG